jgi:hypothetical protein
MTYDEALAQWKQQNPPPITVHENGEDRVLTDEEYEAMAADRAQMLLDQDARQQAEAQQMALEAQVVATQPTLVEYADRLEESAANIPQVEALAGEAPDLVSMPELQQMVSETMRMLNGLIEALEGKGILRVGEIVAPLPTEEETDGRSR